MNQQQLNILERHYAQLKQLESQCHDLVKTNPCKTMQEYCRGKAMAYGLCAQDLRVTINECKEAVK